MDIIKNNELKNISGGGVSWAIISGIISGGIFLIGVIDGYLRPYKCR